MIRKIHNFEIYQRTKDGMFNATRLLSQWNSIRENPKRDLKDFWDLKGVGEFIDVLILEENLHGVNSPYVKSKASRGENAGTWMHPILFIKFAMWLNPKFEYFVIKFVYDELIKFRHSAGDNYKGLTSALNNFENVDYVKLAKGLNYIVFSEHYAGIRQSASSEQLKELTSLQQKLAFSINMGYIKSFDELINEMRRIWDMKHKLYFR